MSKLSEVTAQLQALSSQLATAKTSIETKIGSSGDAPVELVQAVADLKAAADTITALGN